MQFGIPPAVERAMAASWLNMDNMSKFDMSILPLKMCQLSRNKSEVTGPPGKVLVE